MPYELTIDKLPLAPFSIEITFDVPEVEFDIEVSTNKLEFSAVKTNNFLSFCIGPNFQPTSFNANLQLLDDTFELERPVIAINVGEANSIKPVFSVTVGSSKRQSAQFTINSDQPGTVYWQAFAKGKRQVSLLEITLYIKYN